MITANPVLHVEQTRAAGMLGASEAAAALGLDPYTPPIVIHERLNGREVADERPEFVREAAIWGNAIEPVVRGRYAIERKVGVWVPVDSAIRDNWLRCTPDGFVSDDGVPIGFTDSWCIANNPPYPPGTRGLVQVKTCSAIAWHRWHEQPPLKHVIQCRVEMAVCNLPWNDLVYLVGGQRMVVHRIERDATMEADLLRDLKAFVDNARAGVEPDVDASNAWRSIASERMAKADKITMQADDDMAKLLAAWRITRDCRKRYENAEEQYKTRVLLRMSAAGATIVDAGGLGRVTAYKAGGSTDWKSYARSLSDEEPPDRFKRPANTWTLRAPSDWSDTE